MPNIHFTCPQCSQSISAPDGLIGADTECPTCNQTLRLNTAAARYSNDGVKWLYEGEKAMATAAAQTAPAQPREATKHRAFTLLNIVGLFLVVTAGVYSGECLSKKYPVLLPQYSAEAQYEYRIDTIDPRETFFYSGRDLINEEMNLYKGEDGWELKGIIPATRKDESQVVLVYCKQTAPMSPIIRQITDELHKKAIDEAIKKLSQQEAEREKAEFETEMKRIGR
jgi:hypothetical protein